MPGFDIKDVLSAALSATDPDLTTKIADNRPKVGETTEDVDADRYGIYVPSEKTTFTLGQKSAKDEKRHINDVGITGRTDNHVHFHVAKNTKTIVSLGGPSTSVTIDSHDPKVPKESKGYSMVTDELAWHDSKKQHYLVSREGDVVLRAEGKTGAPTALLQSDKGFVTVMAGQGLTVAGKATVKIAAGAPIAIETEQKYDTAVAGKTIEAFDKKHKELGDAAVTQVGAVHGFYDGAIAGTTMHATWGSAERASKNTHDRDAGVALVKDRVVAAEADPTQGTDRLDLHAAAKVSIQAGEHAWIYGKTKATLMADASVAVLANDVIAAGKDSAALWGGKDASVTGITYVAVKAVSGEIGMTAKQDVTIGSLDAGVKVIGKTDVQLSTVAGSTYAHGKTKLYAAAGGGTSYGILGTASEVHLGKMSSGDQYASAAKVAAEGFIVDGSAAKGTFQSSSLELKSSEATMKGSKVNVTADGNVTLKGSKILLG
jgi:hypothetical protein